eukprot:g65030.t1
MRWSLRTGFSAARDAALALRRRLDEEHSPFQCKRLGAELDGLIERALQTRRTEHQEQKRSLEQQLAALERKMAELERKVTALKTELAEADAQLDLDTATLQSVGGEALQALLAAKHEAFTQRWRQWSKEEAASCASRALLERKRDRREGARYAQESRRPIRLRGKTTSRQTRPLGPSTASAGAGRGRQERQQGGGSSGNTRAARGTCGLCRERPVEAVFAPCGHRCCCAECATELRQGGRPCPICRVKIEIVVQRVFD